MFQKACQIFWDVNCQVGGGKNQKQGLHGMGCEVSPLHILTARHVWEETSAQYDYPIVMKHDGIFRSEVAFESADHDLLLLKCKKKISDCNFQKPQSYPKIFGKSLSLGVSVGYITALHLPQPSGDTSRHTCFSSTSVSFDFKDAKTQTRLIVLGGGIMQKGFSGGPVFTVDGSLVGIIVQSLQFATDCGHFSATSYTLPVMSPLFPFKSKIESLISKG